MPVDIKYKFDMAVKPNTSLSRRIYWANEAQKDLDIIHEYHKQQTHGKTDQTKKTGNTSNSKRVG